MYGPDALAWTMMTQPCTAARPATAQPSSPIYRQHAFTGASRGLAAEILVSVVASVIMALMVVRGGEMIGDSSGHAVTPPGMLSASLAPEVDPRDAAVANGAVTPWMERMNIHVPRSWHEPD
jgi:hypothetical protein